MSRRQPSAKTAHSPDGDVRGVLDSIRRVVRVLRIGSREAEKKVGLSGAQLFVLQKLSETRVLTVNELADRTHTHQSSVSVVVQRLVEHGLAARERSEKDGRQVRLSATRAGRTVLRSAPAAAQEQLIDALGRMRAPQLVQLAVSLERLLDLLGIDATEPAGMLFEDDDDSPQTARANKKIKKRRARKPGLPPAATK